MIGNDVVDLNSASKESNWRRTGFLSKVFSQTEQELIQNSENLNSAVWLIWSMKEAAYKAHQREYGLPRKLNWLDQHCSLSYVDQYSAVGKVEVSGQTYYSKSIHNTNFIHTQVHRTSCDISEQLLLQAPGSVLKRKLLTEISNIFCLDHHLLNIKKDKRGIPYITDNKDFKFTGFSLSGHGRYTAYILSLINCETPVKQS